MVERRSGRTLAMVKELPATGAVIVVHTSSMADYVKQMIHDVRGSSVLNACKVAVLTTQNGATNALAGERRPVFLDHAFTEFARLPVVSCTQNFAIAINRRIDWPEAAGA